MSEDSGQTIVLILVPVVLLFFCVSAGACGTPEDERFRESTRKREYEEFVEEVATTMSEKRTDPANIETESIAAPRSGSHIAEFKSFKIGTKKEEEEEKKNRTLKDTFTADLSLTFIKDDKNGEGYHITGKRLDKYGQTIIQDGFMCNTGHAFWQEKYISSNARHIADDSSAASYWDGPRVEEIPILTMGKFIIYDEENQGRMTFEGIWHCKHKAIPSGKVKMKTQMFGEPIVVGSEGQNLVIAAAVPVEINVA